MNCDEVVLELGPEEPSPAVRAHLAGCASCREAAQVVGWAALPRVSQTERAALDGLPRRLLAATARAAPAPARATTWRMAGALALAACVGAFVASSVLVGTRTEPAPERVVLEVPVEAPVLPEYDEANLFDDEGFFEVSWPDLNQPDSNGAQP
jgi:predicted anti-sigma-YlaC factor YlaD